MKLKTEIAAFWIVKTIANIGGGVWLWIITDWQVAGAVALMFWGVERSWIYSNVERKLSSR